jgi:hypothetical protein
MAVLAVACGSLSGEGTRDPSLSASPPPGVTSDPTAVPWRVANGITACGIVREYMPATVSSAGTLRIGTRSYSIAPGTAALGSNGFVPRPDAAMCVWGGLNGSPGAAPDADAIGEYRCGRVREYVAPTSSASGRLRILDYWSDGELDLVVPVVGASLGKLWPDDYRCFSIDAHPGDAVVTGRDTRLADVELACGRVRNYAPATGASPGVITVGSHTFGIPAGVYYQMDPAGARVDPITPGVVTCLRAQLDDSGTIARYGPVMTFVAPAPNGLVGAGITGRVVAFKAPTGTADGYVALALNSVPLRIPAGTHLSAKAAAYRRTYDVALDAQGDLIAVVDKDEPPVQVN